MIPVRNDAARRYLALFVRNGDFLFKRPVIEGNGLTECDIFAVFRNEIIPVHSPTELSVFISGGSQGNIFPFSVLAELYFFLIEKGSLSRPTVCKNLRIRAVQRIIERYILLSGCEPYRLASRISSRFQGNAREFQALVDNDFFAFQLINFHLSRQKTFGKLPVRDFNGSPCRLPERLLQIHGVGEILGIDCRRNLRQTLYAGICGNRKRAFPAFGGRVVHQHDIFFRIVL